MDDKLQILIEIKEKLEGLDKTRREVQGTERDAKKLGETLKVALGTGIGFLGAQAVARVTGAMKSGLIEGIKYNAMIEQQTVAFTTLLGSQERALQRMREIQNLAAETPFETDELIRTSRLLQSLGGDSLAGADGLRMIGDTAAATGQNIEGVAFAVGRLKAGMDAGISVAEFTLRLVEMGLISMDTKRKLDALALGQGTQAEGWKAAQEALSRYSGSMATQAQTMNGRLSTLKDAWSLFWAEVTKGESSEVKGVIDSMITELSDPANVANMQSFIAGLSQIVQIGGEVASVLREITEGLGTYAGAISLIVDREEAKSPWERAKKFVEDRLRLSPAGMIVTAIQAHTKLDEFNEALAEGYGAPALGRPRADSVPTTTATAQAAEPPTIDLAPMQIQGGRSRYALQQDLGENRAAQQVVSGDPFALRKQQQEELLPLLEEERALIAEIRAIEMGFAGELQEEMELLQSKGELTETEKTRLLELRETQSAALAEATELGLRIVEIGQQLETMSFGGEILASLTEYENGFMSMGDAAAAAAQGIESSLSSAITNAIMEGEFSWEQFGQMMLESFIQIGAQMLAQRIMQLTVLNAVNSLFKTKEVAETTAIEGAKTGIVVAQEGARTAAMATASTTKTGIATGEAAAVSGATGIAGVFRSIMELGPIAGPLVFAAAIGGMIALVKGISGREKGGPVSRGTPYIVGERRPELFIPDTAGTILPYVPSLAQPRSLGTGAAQVSPLAQAAMAGGGGASGEADDRPMAMILVDNRDRVAEMQRDPRFRYFVMDIMKQGMATRGR